MTPRQIKEARRSLGLTQTQLAALLRMGDSGKRQVRRWETGETPVSGPASVAIEYMLREHEHGK